VTPRTIQIGASFAIVLVAYSAYALLAVPWIEPPPLKPSVAAAGGKRPLPNTIDRNVLTDLFPSDSWQVRDAKIINSDGRAMLLWRTYKNNQNGWVDLTPLTVILLPKEEENFDARERVRHSVVMDVPEGANLRFDRPLDLNKGGIGRLIEGRLHGPVKIRRQGKKPDHSDDLFVSTHDVDLSEQRITTASDVDFRLGNNYGRGRQMEIKLLPRLGPHEGNQELPNIGGIEDFQLEHVEHMHLEMASADSASYGPAGSPQSPAGAAQHAGPPGLGSLSSHSGPVEITCRGPFHFHVTEPEVATFRDQVDVLRAQPDGQSDRLSCELLSIFFTRPALPPGAKAKQGPPGFDLEPSRIEAVGTPTTITAPTDHVQARAERLQYNLKDGQICLDDSVEVMLQKDTNEIHAPSLSYTPGPPNHPQQFRLLAAGPGWLRGAMAQRPGQQLEARWQQKLEVRPQDQNQVISLLGGARLNFQAMGRLDAEEIHFWLHEAPPDAAGHSALKPDRLLAEKNVVGDSPQFSSKVDRLEVWFTSAPPAAPLAGIAAAANAANPRGTYLPSTLEGPALAPLPDTSGGSALPAPAAAAVASSPTDSPLIPLGMPKPAAAGGRQSHVEISGRLLQARVLLRDQALHDQPSQDQPLHDQPQGELTEVTVTDRVQFRETQTASPGDKPLLVTGQWLHAAEANTPQAKFTVKGEPAHMEGRGMSLTGPNIFIDRGGNVLAMEGPGVMEQFLDHDLENRPLTKGSPLKIDWQKGMLFDGRKAHFQDSVNVVSETKLLQTGVLDVYFQQPVSFSRPQPQQQPKVERIVCGGGLFIENRTIKDGQQTSYDRMALRTLDLNNITGEFHGDGPGWLVTVNRGGAKGFSLPGGPLAGGSLTGPARPAAVPVGFGPAASQAPDPNALTCLHLRFMRGISGNQIHRDIVFRGQVRAARASAQSWTTTLESDDPNRLGPQAFVLYSDSMQVDDMSPVSGGSGGNLELMALDNVIVVGTNFTSRSARLTYTQSKDLVILEGDGRSDAEIFKQDGGEGSKASRFAAQKLEYNVKSGLVKTEGVRGLDLNQAQGGRMKPRAN
jgi:hypothetical protein